MPETVAPILTAAEEEAGLQALRQAYSDLADGVGEFADEDDDQPEVVLGVMPMWPKGSRGARIRAGFIYESEVSEHRTLQGEIDYWIRDKAGLPGADALTGRMCRAFAAGAEARYALWMNEADWIDGYGIPMFRQDFDPISGTYPSTMKAG